VTAERRTVLDNYDLRRHARGREAVVELVHVSVDDGMLDLSFAGVLGEALVSAVVIVPTDVPEEALPYSAECAPEIEREVASAKNLRMIGLGIQFYANENRGRLPPDLATVLATQDLIPGHFANPRSLTNVPRGELSLAENVGWVDSLNDYVYAGPGLTFRHPPQTPLAWENPDRVTGNIQVLRLDGSVVSMGRAEAAELLGFDPDAEPRGARPPADRSAPECVPDPDVLQSAAKLRAMYQAMARYANENRGTLPLDAGILQEKMNLPLAVLVNPRGDTPPPPDGMSREERLAWVNAASDYVYLGAGRRSTARAEVVLAYENPAALADGILVLFADGRVEFREVRWAAEILPKPAEFA
jgi:hypothetical protein